jgi:hypothetical protein
MVCTTPSISHCRHLVLHFGILGTIFDGEEVYILSHMRYKLVVAGITMLLTLYKVFDFRNNLNTTWVPPRRL